MGCQCYFPSSYIQQYHLLWHPAQYRCSQMSFIPMAFTLCLVPSKLWQQLSASTLQATDSVSRKAWGPLIACFVEQRFVYWTHSLRGQVPFILAIPLTLSFSNEQCDQRNMWKNSEGEIICNGLSQSKNLVQCPQN